MAGIVRTCTGTSRFAKSNCVRKEQACRLATEATCVGFDSRGCWSNQSNEIHSLATKLHGSPLVLVQQISSHHIREGQRFPRSRVLRLRQYEPEARASVFLRADRSSRSRVGLVFGTLEETCSTKKRSRLDHLQATEPHLPLSATTSSPWPNCHSRHRGLTNEAAR